MSSDLDAEIDEVLSEELGDTSDIEIVEIQEDQSRHENQEPREASEGHDGNGTESRRPSDGTSSGIKNLRCPICLETPEIIAVAPCGHPYCHECIFTALSSARRANRKEGECSLCRKRVRYDQVIYMEMKKGPTQQTNENTNVNHT